MHVASSLSGASCPPLCSYYTLPQEPTTTILSTRRVSESAPRESSKDDRGGSESSRFKKHRAPLLWWGTGAVGHAWETGSQVLGAHGSLGIQNDHWRVLSLKDRMPLCLLRKSQCFHRQEGLQLLLCSRLNMQGMRDECTWQGWRRFISDSHGGKRAAEKMDLIILSRFHIKYWLNINPKCFITQMINLTVCSSLPAFTGRGHLFLVMLILSKEVHL